MYTWRSSYFIRQLITSANAQKSSHREYIRHLVDDEAEEDLTSPSDVEVLLTDEGEVSIVYK